ncbi:MAG TPA: peptide chain release factor N(5)-glutamine methyltransferase [Candidatus Saccharimonadales bacterium]
MSANLPQQTPAIKDWLRRAVAELVAAEIPSAKLDAEIILAHTLRRSRTYLHAHDDEELSLRDQEIADARLRLRLDRIPIAYIVGHKEFYGRLFHVTPATLIPRPESEVMITLLKEYAAQTKLDLHKTIERLVDVGTGSGCLGITAKRELPELDTTLIDVSRHALTVAETNAKRLEAEVTTLRSNLLSDYPFTANYILANLPYVDESWQRSPETNHEPALALFADDDGLALINKLIDQAPTYLASNGLLFLEADPRQHAAIIRTAKNRGLTHQESRDFIVVLRKS